MSVNKDRPHVLVLPEDDANRQLADNFHIHVDWNRLRQMQVLRPAGGWTNVLKLFESEHVVEMQRNPLRFMILLFDLDGSVERLKNAQAQIPEQLTGRVFVLGALTTPEALRRTNLGSYEDIGLAMANDCREGSDKVWSHELLRHNASELARLRELVRPFLFV
jgi:hypothetical protein